MKVVEIFSFLLICHINAWGQMWDIRRHLWKWVNRKVDFVVVHVETSYIQRGAGKLDVGEFEKEAERLVDQIDRQFGKGLGMWSGLIPRVDQGETAIRRVRQANDELDRVMKKKGWDIYV